MGMVPGGGIFACNFAHGTRNMPMVMEMFLRSDYLKFGVVCLGLLCLGKRQRQRRLLSKFWDRREKVELGGDVVGAVAR